MQWQMDFRKLKGAMVPEFLMSRLEMLDGKREQESVVGRADAFRW